jgi:hypothetical protein
MTIIGKRPPARYDLRWRGTRPDAVICNAPLIKWRRLLPQLTDPQAYTKVAARTPTGTRLSAACRDPPSQLPPEGTANCRAGS